MSGKKPDAQGIDRKADSLIDFSPSRLTLAGKCGTAFEYQYIRNLPAPHESARAMFGNAIHDGTQIWYGDEGSDKHKNEDLAPIVLARWAELLPPKIWTRVKKLRDMDEECKAIAGAILFKRPQLKSPTTTKEYLEAQAVKDFTEKRLEMIEWCDQLEAIKWPKDEDPYKAYVKSAFIAKQMQDRWQDKPRPLAVERPFRIQIGEFSVRGRMDQLRVDPDPRTGEAVIAMVDIKTGMQMMTQMEAFLQSFIYSEAIVQDEALPNTDNIAFFMARHNKYQQGKIDRERHGKIASRIFNGRARQIIQGQFEPSYGFWCKQCDFNGICENELRLWPGDGITMELMEC